MSGAGSSLRAILSGALGMSMAAALSAGAADQDSARTFSFTYEAEVPAQPVGAGSIDVFIPLAVSDAHQTILRRDVKASIPGRETIESRYGNMFWHGHGLGERRHLLGVHGALWQLHRLSRPLYLIGQGGRYSSPVRDRLPYPRRPDLGCDRWLSLLDRVPPARRGVVSHRCIRSMEAQGAPRSLFRHAACGSHPVHHRAGSGIGRWPHHRSAELLHLPSR